MTISVGVVAGNAEQYTDHLEYRDNQRPERNGSERERRGSDKS